MQVASVKYQKTGGFIGVFKGCTVDVPRLPPDERAKVNILLEQSAFMTLKSSTSKSARDVLRYHVEAVTAGGERHEVTFDDTTLPNSMRPLIDYLDDQSNDLLPE